MIRNMRRKLRKNRGFTLVELMIVVAIVGILAALAIYGVRKYMANAKSAEARNGLGQIGKDAITAYAKEGMEATVLEMGDSTTVTNQLCTSAKAVPGGADGSIKDVDPPDAIKAKKYQSSPKEWITEGDTSASNKMSGWTCLKFSMNDPQYYMYQYFQDVSTTDTGGKFEAQAKGDLDGDGVGSYFTLLGEIKEKDAKKAAVLAPNLEEYQPDE